MSADTDAVIRVMVVDDHPIWRHGVARDLAEAGFTVVGTARDAAQALRVAAATRPGVILLDLNLPDLSGAELTSRLLAAHPSVRVLVLSASGERRDVLDAVTAGATGYLVKSAEPAELIAAVRTTASGQAVFTAGLAGLVLGEFRRLSGNSGPARITAAGQADAAGPGTGRSDVAGQGGAGGSAAPPTLTARETEILRLIATGLTYPQIAGRLVLSTRTVQNHVQNTLVKLQLHNKAQLVRYAMEQGIE